MRNKIVTQVGSFETKKLLSKDTANRESTELKLVRFTAQGYSLDEYGIGSRRVY